MTLSSWLCFIPHNDIFLWARRANEDPARSSDRGILGLQRTFFVMKEATLGYLKSFVFFGNLLLLGGHFFIAALLGLHWAAPCMVLESLVDLVSPSTPSLGGLPIHLSEHFSFHIFSCLRFMQTIIFIRSLNPSHVPPPSPSSPTRPLLHHQATSRTPAPTPSSYSCHASPCAPRTAALRPPVNESGVPPHAPPTSCHRCALTRNRCPALVVPNHHRR